MPKKLGAYSGGIGAATSQFSGAGEGGAKQIAFEAVVTNDATAELKPFTAEKQRKRRITVRPDYRQKKTKFIRDSAGLSAIRL